MNPSTPNRLKNLARKQGTSARLSLERLEDRTAPAVINVGAGDLTGLRNAINTAVGNGEADTINIAAGTINIDAGRGDNANVTGDLDVQTQAGAVTVDA